MNKKKKSNVWKNIFTGIGFVVGAVVAFLLGRGTDRRTTSDDSESLSQLESGIDNIEQSVNGIESGLNEIEQNNKSIEDRNIDIKDHNNNAIDGIERAEQILRDAKDREIP